MNNSCTYYSEEWASDYNQSLNDRLKEEVEKNRKLSVALEASESEKVRLGQEIESLKKSLSEKTSEFEQKRSEHESACQRLRQDLTRTFEVLLTKERSKFKSRISEITGTVSSLENKLKDRNREIKDLSTNLTQELTKVQLVWSFFHRLNCLKYLIL